MTQVIDIGIHKKSFRHGNLLTIFGQSLIY
jgi:hypothetical protein